jgi:hypothetical protein
MPLIVVDGKVVYRLPTREELPVIGSMYNSSELRVAKEIEKQRLELSESMSLLQKALLKGKKNVV